MATRQTIEQKRASKAWQLVNEVKGENYKDKYNSWAKKLPILILSNGLGPAIAFLRSKNRDELKALYDHLAEWLKNNVSWSDSSNELVERIIKSDSVIYKQATVEALAFTKWLSRFADALLEKEERV